MAARLRRLAFDMREKSGIDEVLRAEGLDRDIAEIRRLARGEIGGVVAAVRSTADAVRPDGAPAATVAATPAPALFTTEREYPPEGADSYGALPETATVYDGSLPPSPLAEDPLYARGEEQPEGRALAEAGS